MTEKAGEFLLPFRRLRFRTVETHDVPDSRQPSPLATTTRHMQKGAAHKRRSPLLCLCYAAALKPLSDLFPVDDMPGGFDRIGPAIAIVDIVGMFPYVHHHERCPAVSYRITGIGFIHDIERTRRVLHQPCPTRPEQSGSLLLEFGRKNRISSPTHPAAFPPVSPAASARRY